MAEEITCHPSERSRPVIVRGVAKDLDGPVIGSSHFSPRGAEMMARLVVTGIHEAELGIAGYLKE